MNTSQLITHLVGIALGAIVFSVLLAYPVMLLWNGCAVPAVTGLHEIDWLQAWGIMTLTSFLFKSSSAIKKD